MRLSLFLAALVGILGMAAEPARERPLAEVLGAIDRLAADNIDPTGPGAAVLVLHEGKVIFQKGYGLADLEKKFPVTPTTTFELASISKPFTALAILMLIERGRLGLEDDVRKYIPELPVFDPDRPIRIADLLRHTSGLPDHLGFLEVAGLNTPTTDDVIRRTATKKLAFPTGSKWAYSNVNFRLLAAVVERVSTRRLADFLKAEVFEPLGMRHTFVRDPARPATSTQAVGYDAALIPIAAWKYLRVETRLELEGEAGVWSCLEDLALWERELRRPTLVRAASLDRAWTDGRTDDGKPIGYGLGWFVEAGLHGRKLSHSGRWPGFTTYFLRYPERDFAVVVLTNYSGNLKAVELAERAGNLLVDPAPTGGPKLTEAEAKTLEGTYRRDGKVGPPKVEVVRRGDELALVFPGEIPFPLVPLAPGRFRIDGSPGESLAFEQEDGAVRAVRLEFGAGQPVVTFRPPARP